ncbi:hypothetical protein [Chryseobacterium indologenes]|uniref:hypothetical protein n=1 Tax=Chryseobacterium indologenes TaxID=253 RepID=UPI001625B258|nr:hypothetical protein [Chryseobacterium indologenes]
MKTKVKRTPSDLIDDLTFFIYNLRQYGAKLELIALIIGRDHSTVLYHLKKYEGLAQFNKEFRNRIENFNEAIFINKMNYSKILKQKIGYSPLQPISAQFIKTATVQTNPLIKPLKDKNKFDEKDMEYVEKWLAFCAIGITVLDTGTKMLSHKGVIGERTAVHDLIKAFKQLNSHFTGNESFDQKEIGIEDFVFSFLTSTEEQQTRVVKFLESILRKS